MKNSLVMFAVMVMYSSIGFAQAGNSECDTERNLRSKAMMSAQGAYESEAKKCKSNDCLMNITAAPGLEKLLELKKEYVRKMDAYNEKNNQCPRMRGRINL